ncbi:MAG: sigma-70 family RNA polymerase sigma factor [Planctomycetes bacterium]|nr:sigma-70 family RNA polymerase sigma factor [Planctomycetota bacterium]
MDRSDAQAPDGGADAGVAGDAATLAFRRFQQSGDRVALEHALRLCAPTLLAAARRRVRSSDVHDVVQECLVVAIRRAAEMPAGVRLLPWLLGILHNKARSRHILRWRRQADAGGFRTDEVAAAEPDPATVVLQQQWRDLIAEQVHALPPHYRDVVAAHLLHGEDLVAVAARAGVSPSTVRSQFARGLALLRRRLPAPLLAGLLATLAVRAANGASGLPPKPGMRLGLVAGGLVLAGCLAWAWWRPDRPAPAVAATLPVPSAPVAAALPPAAPLVREAVDDRAAAPSDAAVEIVLRLASGAPAADVPVVLDPDHRPGQSVNRSAVHWHVRRTDADGRVEFVGLPRRPAAIRLHDLAALHTFQLGSTRQRFHFTVAAAQPVVVHVCDAREQPVLGAKVHVSGAAGGRAPGVVAAVTDGSGYARFVVPMAGGWSWVTSPAHAPSGVHPLSELPLDEAGSERTWRLRLEDSHRWCHGVVVGPDGAPIAGAVVAAWTRASPTAPQFALADPSGRFGIGAIGPEAWQVFAVAPGFAAGSVELAADAASVVCRLEPGGAVHGRVVDAVGRDSVAAGLRRVVSQRIDASVWDGLASCGAVVAADGSFALEHMVPGRHRIGLFVGGSQPVATDVVEVTAGGTSAVQLSPADASLVRVCLRDERGLPLPGAIVTAVGEERFDWPQQIATSDATGCVRFDLRGSGATRLFVNAPHGGVAGAWPNATALVVDATDLVEVVVPDAALLTGGIEGQLGSSLLELVRVRGLWLRRDEFPEVPRVPCEPDGRFVVTGLPAGRYTLEVVVADATGGGRIAVAECVVAAGKTCRLDLGNAPPWLPVAVTLPADGASLPVSCRLRDEAGRLCETLVLAAGATVHRRLPPGRYRLQVPASTAATSTVEFTLDDRAVEVAVPRERGTPCRFEVHGDGVAARRARLHAVIRRAGAAGECAVVLPETDGGMQHAVELDLQPGCYELRVALADGSELCRAFVVGERDEAHVFPFRAP